MKFLLKVCSVELKVEVSGSRLRWVQRLVVSDFLAGAVHRISQNQAGSVLLFRFFGASVYSGFLVCNVYVALSAVTWPVEA